MYENYCRWLSMIPRSGLLLFVLVLAHNYSKCYCEGSDKGDCSDELGRGFLHHWKNRARVSLCDFNYSATSAAFARTESPIWFGVADSRASVVELMNGRLITAGEGHRAGVVVHCVASASAKRSIEFPDWIGIRHADRAVNSAVCSHHVKDLLVVYQYEPHNLYHTFETLMGAYQSAIIADLNPDNISFVFVGEDKELFPPQHLFQYLFPFSVNIAPGRRHRLCFDHAVLSLTSRSSIGPSLWNYQTPCQRGHDLLQDLSNRLLSNLKMTSVKPDISHGLQIMVVDRRNTTGGRELPLVLINSLKQKLSEIRILDGSNRLTTQVTVVNLEDYSIEQQVKMVRSCHTLVAVHGAALTHMLFLNPKYSNVLELVPPTYGPKNGRGVGNIYRNLAKWMGVEYESADVAMPKAMSNNIAHHSKVSERSLEKLLDKYNKFFITDVVLKVRKLCQRTVDQQTSAEVGERQ